MGAMTLIGSVDVSGAGGAASIDFTSIPQTYTDLQLIISARQATTNFSGGFMTVNGSTSGYSVRYLYGQGASALTNSTSSVAQLNAMPILSASTDTANTFGNTVITIPNYGNSLAKSFSCDGVSENNGTTAYQMIVAGTWTGTAAITSISLTISGPANFAQYSSASLYGITKGSGGATAA